MSAHVPRSIPVKGGVVVQQVVELEGKRVQFYFRTGWRLLRRIRSPVSPLDLIELLIRQSCGS